MTITKNISVLVEAGINQIDQSASSVLAGGGLTWMTTPSLQLDISMDIGLNRKSPDFLGGFGFSVFFN